VYRIRSIVPRLAGILLVALAPALACAQQYGKEQIDQLTAQIALYPDSLLSQVLMASTYPTDVAEAAKWSREHPDAKGDEAVAQVQEMGWDPSVSSLVAFPQVIVTMGEKPDWVKDLGDAFLTQPEDVMDSVQRLRTQAQAAGNLKSNEQMTVKVEPAPAPDPQVTVVRQQVAPQQVIVIEPAQPEVIYVPSYNPAFVYGAWPYPAYPPVYVPPPPGYWWSSAIVGGVATGIAWGVSYAVRDALWGGCYWGRRDIDININRYNNVNINRRLDINADRTRWTHDVNNRKGVAYRGGDATKQQLARKYDAGKRDAYRGRAEAAMRDKGIQVDRAAARDRMQDFDRDKLRQQAQNVDRDKLRQQAQSVDRDKLRERAQSVDRDRARQQVQNVDRDRARQQLQGMNRDNAFKGVNSREARPQVDRGNRSLQSLQSRQRMQTQSRPQGQRPQAPRQQVQRGGGGGGARGGGGRPQIQRKGKQ
jgi:hypothetical protein